MFTSMHHQARHDPSAPTRASATTAVPAASSRAFRLRAAALAAATLALGHLLGREPVRTAAAPNGTPPAVSVHVGDVRQPRPLMTGRVGQGSAPCTAVPADAATMTVVLIQDNGDAVCDASDVDAVISAGVNAGTGWYVFAADDAATMTEPNPAYCVVVDRASVPDPAPMGPIYPGVDPEAEVTLDPICVQ